MAAETLVRIGDRAHAVPIYREPRPSPIGSSARKLTIAIHRPTSNPDFGCESRPYSPVLPGTFVALRSSIYRDDAERSGDEDGIMSTENAQMQEALSTDWLKHEDLQARVRSTLARLSQTGALPTLPAAASAALGLARDPEA